MDNRAFVSHEIDDGQLTHLGQPIGTNQTSGVSSGRSSFSYLTHSSDISNANDADVNNFSEFDEQTVSSTSYKSKQSFESKVELEPVNKESDICKCDETLPIKIHRKIMRTQSYLTHNQCNLPAGNTSNNQSSVFIVPSNFNSLEGNFKTNNGFDGLINSEYKNREPSKLVCMVKKIKPKSLSPCKLLVSLFPILSWLPEYSLKNDLISDFISGLTIFALNVPQGLSYGKLAGGDPINGIYVSLFPVIVYALMGTSRHVSIGTFAVISITCKEAVEKFDYSTPLGFSALGENSTSPHIHTDSQLQPIEVLTSLCLLVGIIQLAIGSLRLGILAMLLSDTLISSFVVGSACHVFTSQILSLIGLTSDTKDIDHILQHIPFDLIQIYASVLLRLRQINWVTVGISLTTIVVLILVKSYIEPYLTKKLKMKNLALPIDIVMIIIITVVSAQFTFKETYDVIVIPKIPKAFENLPAVPRIDLFPKLISNAFIIAFIAYVTTYSLGKIFEKKHKTYKVSSNQELIALGSANILGSFLLCFPASGSLARSAVQERVGGRTQIASLVSVSLIVSFLMFFSRYLVTLPQCVLASIIVVALWSTLQKFREFKSTWKTSKMEGIVWLSSFTLVILFGVGNGLIYGLIVSLILLLVQLSFFKYQIPDSEVYVSLDSSTRKNLKQEQINFMSIDKVQTIVIIFDFQGPLIFINTSIFQNKFHALILKEVKRAQEYCQRHYSNGHIKVIFDCSRMTYIDKKGNDTLLELNNDLVNISDSKEIQLLFANLNNVCHEMMGKCNFFDNFDLDRVFMTVHDAYVSAIQHNSIKI